MRSGFGFGSGGVTLSNRGMARVRWLGSGVLVVVGVLGVLMAMGVLGVWVYAWQCARGAVCAHLNMVLWQTFSVRIKSRARLVVRGEVKVSDQSKRQSQCLGLGLCQKFRGVIHITRVRVRDFWEISVI